MRVLGLDIGDRRIGVALSDAVGLTAQRLTVLEREATTADVQAVVSLVAQHQVTAVVAGLPLTLQGASGPQAKKVLSFVGALRRALTAVPVHLLDERLTTVQSERVLRATRTSRSRRAQLVDQVAAQLILQDFLDRRRRGSSVASSEDRTP